MKLKFSIGVGFSVFKSHRLWILVVALAFVTGTAINPVSAQQSSGSSESTASRPSSTTRSSGTGSTDTGVTDGNFRAITTTTSSTTTTTRPERSEERTGVSVPIGQIPESSKSFFSEIATARKDIPVPPASATPTFGSLPDDWVMTQWGPMSPADREFVIAVRLAGLWEGPAGQEAQQKGRNAVVREIGGHISRQHALLDERSRVVGQQLGINLPNRPSKTQMKWLSSLSSLEQGEEYDREFANRLRAAHGGIFPVIADVRAGTRNELVRTFASEVNDVVLGHISMLEATGLVDYTELPTPYHPQTATVMQSMTALLASAGTGNGYLQVGLGLIVLAVMATSWRMFRAGPKITKRNSSGKGR